MCAALAGYPPDERAIGAQHRLESVLAKNGPLQTSTRVIPEGTQVLLDGVQLFVVLPGDVNQLAGDTTESAAKVAAKELSKALTDIASRATGVTWLSPPCARPPLWCSGWCGWI